MTMTMTITKTKKNKKIEEKPTAKKARYFEALGGRKTALAQARIYTKPGSILINNKDYKDYFSDPENQAKIIAPFELMKLADKLSASIKVRSGGINAQAEAIRNAIAKALVKFNADFKKRLRKAGFVTRDARMVERKKYGLKKARRAPQWQKR
jgi:small subunit ribosomal protein S9